MTRSLLLLFLALSASIHTGYAAPKTQAEAEAAAKNAKVIRSAQSPAAAATQTGVLINAITRNESQSRVAFALAKDGKALAPIVISDKAGKSTRLAVEELKKYLDQITGANFPIKTGDGSEGIVVGTMAEFSTPALARALEIVHDFDGREAYAIRTREKRVLLLGATELGASHAVYRMLEELGCRWFFPNATDNWEVVPQISDLKFNKDITDRPAFLSRDIWYAWWIFADEGHPRNTPATPRHDGFRRLEAPQSNGAKLRHECGTRL